MYINDADPDDPFIDDDDYETPYQRAARTRRAQYAKGDLHDVTMRNGYKRYDIDGILIIQIPRDKSNTGNKEGHVQNYFMDGTATVKVIDAQEMEKKDHLYEN